MNLGDIALSQVLYFHFTTRQFSTGTPITSALLAVSIYKDDGTTESTTGITTTFSSGFDGVAGLVSVKIDTSADGTFYASGHDFSIVVTGGTSDGVSIIGEVVGYFSIQNRSALRPTTAGRTLDVAATGEAGLDFDNIKDATGAHTLTNITVPIVTTAQNLTTNNDKTGYALTAAYDPAKTAAQAGDAMTLTVGERTSVGTAVWASATRTLTSFGTLAADVWASVSRTLTAFAFTVDTNANATETAIKLKTDNLPALPASTTNITAGTITTATNLTTNNDKTGYALTAAYDAAKTAAQAGDSMNVSKINGATVAGTGQPADLWRGA